jgi:subtilase family serine protease
MRSVVKPDRTEGHDPMTFRTELPRRTAALAAAAAATTAVALSAGAAGGTTATASGARAHVKTPAVGAHPHRVRAALARPGSSVVFSCQTDRPAGLRCCGPDQIRAAYSIAPLIAQGQDGRGRTIVVIDAFSPPAVAQDLAGFDAVWGLPDPSLTIVAPQGATPWDATDANQVGWAGETALDVEWAHAVAPGARIVLVQSRSDEDGDLLAATKWAVDHGAGDVITQSFGEDERCVDPALDRAEHQVFERATDRGITLLASSGDSGSAQPSCDLSSYSLAASSPAVDPDVTAVGGTALNADLTTGAYQGETVWNDLAEFGPYGGASGGGYSTLVRKPEYQSRTVKGRYRAVPDISYNAAVDGGVLTYITDEDAGGPGNGGFYLTGGTSAGSPQWAGIVAIADQVAHRRIGALNEHLYELGRSRHAGRYFHDVTVGENSFVYDDGTATLVTIPGYTASKGWDATTGWGTPIASALVPWLAAHAD